MLKDRFGRRINYLRVSITNRCNFNCIYCNTLPVKDIDYPIENFLKIIYCASSIGIKNIRITGGEPFIKKYLLDFLKELKKMNLNIAITTNASLIKESFIPEIVSLKIKKFNISLDSIHNTTFLKITKKNCIKTVLQNINQLKKETKSNEIKINTVLLNKINSDEIYDMINFASQQGLILKFIEYMPIGLQNFNFKKSNLKKLFFPIKNIVQNVVEKYNLNPIEYKSLGPGKYYKNKNTIIGFVCAISTPFCSSCNRLRITSDLKLRACLGNNIELDLKNLSEKEIKKAFFLITEIKPIQHRFESTPKDCMRNIGG